MQSQPTHAKIALPVGFKLVPQIKEQEFAPKLPPGITIKSVPKKGPAGFPKHCQPISNTPVAQRFQNKNPAVASQNKLERETVAGNLKTNAKTSISAGHGTERSPKVPQPPAKKSTPAKLTRFTVPCELQTNAKALNKLKAPAVPSGRSGSRTEFIPKVPQIPAKSTPLKRQRIEEDGIPCPELDIDYPSDSLVQDAPLAEEPREISLDYVIMMLERMDKKIHAECLLNVKLKNEIRTLRHDISLLREEIAKISAQGSITTETGSTFVFPIENDQQLEAMEKDFSSYENQLQSIFGDFRFNSLYDLYRHFAEEILKNVSFHNWTGTKAHNSTKEPKNASILKIFKLLLDVGMQKTSVDIKTATSMISRAINNYNFASNRLKLRHAEGIESAEETISSEDQMISLE